MKAFLDAITHLYRGRVRPTRLISKSDDKTAKEHRKVSNDG